MNRVLLQAEWKLVLQQIYRVVRPGGVIELLEPGKFGLHRYRAKVFTSLFFFSGMVTGPNPKEWIAHKYVSQQICRTTMPVLQYTRPMNITKGNVKKLAEISCFLLT